MSPEDQPESQNVPEWMHSLWRVLEHGEFLFAELWSLPHAADAASRIERLSLNDLRAIALSQVSHLHKVRDLDYGTTWESEGAEVRSWLESPDS